MKTQEVIDLMNSRFTSLNGIPVERASITRDEWQTILKFMKEKSRTAQVPECSVCGEPGCPDHGL